LQTRTDAELNKKIPVSFLEMWLALTNRPVVYQRGRRLSSELRKIFMAFSYHLTNSNHVMLSEASLKQQWKCMEDERL
jgi:hypothetical protein